VHCDSWPGWRLEQPHAQQQHAVTLKGSPVGDKLWPKPGIYMHSRRSDDTSRAPDTSDSGDFDDAQF
jgi:hypothetical protein